MSHFKHFFQTIFFFIIESAISAAFIYTIWFFIFQKRFDINISYTEIMLGIFIIKMIMSNILSIVLELDKQAEYNEEITQ